MTKERIEWIDIAKGISIILVVLGHTRVSAIPYLGDWLGSFRMPFFFFISGLLFNPNKHIKSLDFIKNKWLRLLRPFIIFSALILFCFLCIDSEEFDNRIKDLSRLGWGGYALWFIPVIFAVTFIYFFICKISPSKLIRFLTISVLAIIGYIFYAFKIPNYWNLNFVFTAIFFYGCGNLLAKDLSKQNKISSIPIIIYFTIFALISFAFIFNTKPEFYVNHLGNGILTHIVAISGSLMMCCFAILLTRVKYLFISWFKPLFIYFGKNSYIVLAFHQIIIIFFQYHIPWISSIVHHILMWGILILLIEIINRKFIFILGRNNPKDLTLSRLK